MLNSKLVFRAARSCVRLLSPNEFFCMQSKTCFLARYRVRPTVIFGSAVAQMTPRGQISGLCGSVSWFQVVAHSSWQRWPAATPALFYVLKTEIRTRPSGAFSVAFRAQYVPNSSLQYACNGGSRNSSGHANWGTKLQPFALQRLQCCNVSTICYSSGVCSLLIGKPNSRILDSLLNGPLLLYHCR
jgi:hypothetical protein